MENCEPLIWYGALVMLITGSMMLVPFLRRKGDLISAWNLLLLGNFIFLGMGCIEAATSPMRFHGLHWFNPTREEVRWFMLANTIFLVTMVGFYYYDPLPRKIAGVALSNWPPFSVPLVFYVLIACALVIIINYASSGIVFLAQVFQNFSHKAVVFASVFSFVLWYRNRLNVVWLGLFVAVFLAGCFYAMLSFGGRRLILTVLLGPVLCVYMYHARYWRPAKSAVVVAIAAVGLFMLTLMYSAVRHYDRVAGSSGRTAAGLVEQLEKVGRGDWLQHFLDNQLFYFSQQTVHYSLLSEHFVNTGMLEPKFLNSVKFVLAYPIPRSIWPQKPVALGATIVQDIVGYRATSWGCGIAGHAAYEGGLLLAVLFGYFAAFGAKLVDSSLQRQPTNPFLIAILAAASAHILAWPRGDLGNMTNEILECFLFAVVLGLSGRVFFGTDRSYQLGGSATMRFPVDYRDSRPGAAGYFPGTFPRSADPPRHFGR
jgi:hypothetical protein